MRIYRNNDDGAVVYAFDYPVPTLLCDELDSGSSVHFEIPQRPRRERLIGDDDNPDFSAVMNSVHILLEPFRFYRDGRLVEKGAKIANPHHADLLMANIYHHRAASSS